MPDCNDKQKPYLLGYWNDFSFRGGYSTWSCRQVLIMSSEKLLLLYITWEIFQRPLVVYGEIMIIAHSNLCKWQKIFRKKKINEVKQVAWIVVETELIGQNPRFQLENGVRSMRWNELTLTHTSAWIRARYSSGERNHTSRRHERASQRLSWQRLDNSQNYSIVYELCALQTVAELEVISF